MAALIRLAILGALLLATPADADPVARWRSHILEASARFGIPVAWIERVMRAESGGRTHLEGRPITSHAGAMGLMQLMPGTWAELRLAHGLGSDPHDPRDNILAGTAYLRAMYDRFGYPGMFGAYHAGPGRYAANLRRARPLPSETRAYLAAVAGDAPMHTIIRTSETADTIFAVRRTLEERHHRPVSEAPEPGPLFVPLARD